MRPVDPWVHRLSILLAIFALVVIISGASITSIEVASQQSQTVVSVAMGENLHRALGIALFVFALGMGIALSRTRASGWLRIVAWTGFTMVGIDAILGWNAPPLSPARGVFHALLAHLFLSLVVVVAVGTSTRWNSESECVDGSKRPLLRPAAIATPLVVLVQIVLGAAYRHDMTSIMPHMAVAMGVAFIALIVCSTVLQNFPEPKSIRHAAVSLISIVLTQVSLGITAFVLLVLNLAGTLVFILVTVGHVTIGATTLAASVVMAIQVWRRVTNKVQ